MRGSAGAISLVFFVALLFSSSSRTGASARQKENAIRKAVEKEVRKLPNHPWSGEYYEGDGLGTNISLFLGPQSGFMYQWHGCRGLYGHNYGSVNEANGKVVLNCTLENDEGAFGSIFTQYVSVIWDKRHYLVPASEMVGFCNDVNSGKEPRETSHGKNLLKVDDWNYPATGTPRVPAEYVRYLLSTPVSARVTEVLSVTSQKEVDGRLQTETTLTINAGASSGLLAGMVFFVSEPDVLMSFTVVSVLEKTAECHSTDAVDPGHRPAVGWLLSTKAKKTR